MFYYNEINNCPNLYGKTNYRNKNSFEKIFTSTHDLMFSGHTIVFIFLGRLIEVAIIVYNYISLAINFN